MTTSPHENTDLAKCVDGLPRILKIGAYDWKIIVETADSDDFGEMDLNSTKITLWQNNMTSPGHLVGTTLHECLHVMFENYGLEQMKRDKKAREEQIVSAFESGLISLLRDNPKLLTWMKKWLGKPI
jgi:hypothetical protein